MTLRILGAALVLLLIDSAIELAFVSSMVGYLHRSGANQYPFVSDTGNIFLINAKPKGLLLNEGHTSNGAAGTCLVLISIGGFLVLWRERRREQKNTAQRPSRLFLTYTVFTVLSACLTVSALAYTFAVTNQTKGQTINRTLAREVQGHAYPQDNWTPENWTKALLALPIASNEDASYIRHWLRIMEGWKWNLIPMFLIDVAVASLSVKACLQGRKLGKTYNV